MDELTRMGANIKVESNIAIINGVTRYTGARVNAPDLRAGAALVIAGLVAEGITVIDDIILSSVDTKNLIRSCAALGHRLKRYRMKKKFRSLF